MQIHSFISPVKLLAIRRLLPNVFLNSVENSVYFKRKESSFPFMPEKCINSYDIITGNAVELTPLALIDL